MKDAVKITITLMLCIHASICCFSQTPRMDRESRKYCKKIFPEYLELRNQYNNKTQELWVGDEYLDKRTCVPIFIDSLVVTCRVERIIRTEDNYVLEGKKWIRCVVYIIDVRPPMNENELSYMRIISISDGKEDGDSLLIKEGNQYDFYLVSYFAIDHSKIKYKGIIYSPPDVTNRNQSYMILNNIWLKKLDMGYNYYKTPNLTGLKYKPIPKE